ncbi:nuclear transport factor 2 family protein [Rhizobium phaseoli]|uniref:nuclear transport factor 2 family protein n=1 Tax=Rhizobium phaseoli TaxID=396 RepID=UPI001F164F19|nr:nuclear transport factor 2 family protein [Rhizobium phaseoli]
MQQDNPLSSMQILEKMFDVEMAFMASKGKDSVILAEAFHTEVVVHEPTSVPYAGDWRGLAGVAELMHLMSETFSTFEVENLTCSGPPASMHVSCTLRMVSRKTGISVSQPFAQLLRFQEGLLIEATPFYFDTDEIKAALEVPPVAEVLATEAL